MISDSLETREVQVTLILPIQECGKSPADPLGRNYYSGDICNQNYGDMAKPKVTVKDSWPGLKAAASAGGQVTIFGGGKVDD